MRARVFVSVLLAACGGSAVEVSDAGTDAFVAAPVTVVARAPSASSPRVSIGEGVVLAGSRPGTAWRRPAVEADLAPVDVAAFEIDRRADAAPGRSDATRVALATAQSTCSARGGRLCDELEWERACEGNAHSAWPTSDFASCAAHPEACVTASGVIAMGVTSPEWTRSGDRFVLRGARDDQDAPLHRCDARVVLADTVDREAAVRCCYGAAPALTYPTPTRLSAPFAPLEIDRDALRATLRTMPELASWADAFTPFTLDEAVRAYSRADLIATDVIRARVAPGPLLWSPSHGERAWVVAGESGEDTLIAVLYPLDDEGTVVHGASFVFHGEHVPVALTADPRDRTSIAWATAVGRVGESGTIRLDEDGVIRIASQ
jgi:hypothetical protein